jgi:oxygen-independent coproporphyrinogen-3 oxidase
MTARPPLPELREEKRISLVYANIPFCKYRCRFCCFCRKFGPGLLALGKWRTQYLAALKKEIAIKGLFFSLKHDVALRAVNFGGGTPTLLEAEEILEFLHHILSAFPKAETSGFEVSVEATPDSLSPAKLSELNAGGFTRISIGAQTFSQKIMAGLDRRHSVAAFYKAYGWAREAGFENINIDLLYLFPGQTRRELASDLETAVKLAPEHISPSPLIELDNALFRPQKGRRPKPAATKLAWVRYVHEFLEDHGYRAYYHKYFSRPGKESRTELVYFYDVPYVGVGAGATSWREKNENAIPRYVANPATRGFFTRKTPFNPAKGIVSMLLFPEGIHIASFDRKYGCDLEAILLGSGKEPDYFENLTAMPDEAVRKARLDWKELVETLRRWKARRILEKSGGFLRIMPGARFSRETWGLYMSEV